MTKMEFEVIADLVRQDVGTNGIGLVRKGDLTTAARLATNRDRARLGHVTAESLERELADRGLFVCPSISRSQPSDLLLISTNASFVKNFRAMMQEGKPE